ncbi:unnamed protein product [Parnassius mnemosyne]|uniref:Uncharacterized protein n=1 Tax=Parnassius mnemosyne TaxID=213953 RepID=A0AAV1LBS1_9NEOP
MPMTSLVEMMRKIKPYQVSEHDTDSEQECDDDLNQVFSNNDKSLEMANEEHLGLRLLKESMEVLESAFSDGDEELLINISSRVATLSDIENLKVQSQSLTDYVNGLKEILKTQLNLNEQLITDVKKMQIDLNPIKSTIINIVNELGSYKERVDSSFHEIKKVITYQRLKMALESRHLAFELFQTQLIQTIDKCNIHYLSESLISKMKLGDILSDVIPQLNKMLP